MTRENRNILTQARFARALAVLLMAGLVVVVEPVPTSPAEAQEGCQQGPGTVSVGCIAEWASGGRGSTSGGGGGTDWSGGGGERPACVWQAFDLADLNETQQQWIAENQHLPGIDAENPQWWWKACGHPLFGGDYVPCHFEDQSFPANCFNENGTSTALYWSDMDGEPPAPGVAPEPYLLHRAYLLAQGRMALPELAMSPPEGRPTIVQEPSFVEVTNWSTEWDDGSSGPVCLVPAPPDGPVCVTLSWETDLVFVPGEPGAAETLCEPPGTSYDGGQDPAEVAAADGACAHTYTQHTRGAPYDGEVRVDWNFEWSSNTGYGGVFDPVEMATPFSRAVDEVQTIQTDVPELDL